MKTYALKTNSSDQASEELKILVIDDDQLMLDVLEKKLKEKNYEVITRSDPLKALNVIYSHHIDVVISDVLMPGISGFNLLSFLKKLSCRIPVILISSLDETSVYSSAKNMEIAGFVSKPINFKDLYEKIESARPAA